MYPLSPISLYSRSDSTNRSPSVSPSSNKFALSTNGEEYKSLSSSSPCFSGDTSGDVMNGVGGGGGGI